MNILVSGGAGFIGSNFILYMREKYPLYRLVCLDLLTYAGNAVNLAAMKGDAQFRFVIGDITDSAFVENLFKEEKFDMVVNFAAESHVDRSIHNPNIFLTTNIIGSQVLMDIARKQGVKRYHQVSTDEVYGDLPLDRPDLAFTEDMPLKASSPYSASKGGADLLVLAYSRTYGLPVTISRCSNNYGPYQFPEKLIPLVITRALDDQSIPVYGTGLNVRDWIYVKDHCEAIDAILHTGKEGLVYNVGGGCERKNIEVIADILRIMNKPQTLIQYVDDRPGHDLRYAINYTRIKDSLHWESRYNFQDAIEKTVSWYLENKDWWKAVMDGSYMEYRKMIYGE